MKRLLIIGPDYIEWMEAIEKVNSATRQNITFYDLMEFYISVNTIPETIQKTRQEMEELAVAMTSLSNEKKKIVINEIPRVNPHERQYKNKRKW